MPRPSPALLAGLAVTLLTLPRPARAGDPADLQTPRVYVELPLLDAPFNTAHGGRWPSMQQSLWLAADGYEVLHTALRRVADPYGPPGWNRFLGIALLVGADLLTINLPPMLAWQHEEWHRAVLANHGIDSFDDIYNFRIFDELISVSHVRDEDLVRLKAQHPADQVRLGMAGIEGNQELIAALERVSFFEGSRAAHLVILPLLAFNNSAYLFTCASSSGDELTDELLKKETSDLAPRDFTGLDCTGWVYDLFTPDEPYGARGLHPSGAGINRYRKRSDLTAEGRDYLERQAWFSLVNFLDPRMFGLRRLASGGADGRAPSYWNLALRHLPAAFGYAFRGDLYWRRAETRLFGSLYAYGNGQRLLPGADATLLGLPLGPLALSPRLALWLQPRRLRYDSRGLAPGGLAGLRLGWRRWERIQPFVEVEGKTEGWVPGIVQLGASLSVRTGLSAYLF
jgi:hypothetical protein